MSPQTDTVLNEKLQQRFRELPKVVQDAIQSADVQKRMRDLAQTQKLHLDQWEALENEVMLALLGFQKAEDLKENIKKEVGVDDAAAGMLAQDISKIVFEPIRDALERGLEHPDVKSETLSSIDAARTQALKAEQAAPHEDAKKVARTPAVSEAYKAGTPSSERSDIHNDPYRESPL